MQFKGQLLIPNESGPGLKVNLDVAAHHLAVESETGGLGAWPLEVVDVRRLHGDIFAMTVAGEDLHFVADDTISFAYSGLPAIERVTRSTARSPLRALLDRIWNGVPKQPSEGEPVSQAPHSRELAPSSMDEPPTVELPTDVEETVSHEWNRAAEPADHEPTLPADAASAPGPDQGIAEEPTHTDRPDWEDPSKGSVFDVSALAAVEMDPFDDAGSPEREKSPVETSGCPAIRSDGLPCRSPILTSSGYCYPHDPERSVAEGYRTAQLARARLEGKGTARLDSVYDRLDKAMRQVELGELDPEIAVAMAHLARTMCAILDLDDETGAGADPVS